VRFFFDSCIAVHIAKALDVLGERQEYPRITSQRDLSRDSPLAATKKDWEWIPVLAADGSDWIIISGDQRISRGLHERAAWLQSGLTAFFLADAWASKSFWDQTVMLAQRWPKIVETARATPSGAGYVVPLTGEFKVIRVPDLKRDTDARMKRFNRSNPDTTEGD
jgi:hypothetical protein